MSTTELYELRPDEEISSDLMERILEALLPFSAVLAAVRNTQEGQQVRFVGSGTLVEVTGRPHILTAAHVWTEALEKADRVAVHLGGKRDAITFPRDLITPRVLGQRPFDDRVWGPDIALLEIPATVRGMLEGYGTKTFYNMNRVKEDILAADTSPRPGAWVIMGCPAESSAKTEGNPLDIRGFAFFGFRTEFRDVGGFDFLDVSVNPPTDASVPTSMKGVSGGGLWWTPLTKHGATGEITWDGTRRLEGVAFREEYTPQRLLRCHWRKSLYHHGLEALRRGE